MHRVSYTSTPSVLALCCVNGTKGHTFLLLLYFANDAHLVAKTGVITYSKKGMEGKPIFQCHPVERPFRK